MEYVDLVHERIESRDRELAQMRRANEARRLGLGAPSPFARLDSLLIRVAKGASQRQARRGYSSNREGLLS